MVYWQHYMVVKNKPGFTIVELLIVVVVIAILATITIATYSGIQDRAQRVSAFQAANDTAKLLNAYFTVNNNYPSFSSDVCLGGYRTDNLCYATAGLTPARDTAFESAIASMGKIPSFPVDKTGGNYTGLIFKRDAGRTLNGQLAEYSLVFYIYGSGTKCGIPNSVRWTSSVYAYNDYDSTWASTTQCRIILPQPS
jgi:prepilin-type N-terminal cleavage/methylation domain-containing protein